MNIPITPFLWFVSLLPILTLLVLMLGFGLGAMKAAPVGIAVTALSGLLFF